MPQLADGRTELSQVLIEERPWVEVKEGEEIPADQPLVVRLVNRNIVYGEDKEKKLVLHAEDVAIAIYNKEKDEWNIAPPYLKFDYSPLTNKNKLTEGTLITHYAVPEKDEVSGWGIRLLPSGDYEELKLIVDDKNIENVYRAFAWGAEALHRIYIRSNDPNVTPEEKNMVNGFIQVLHDLQYMIDSNVYYSGGKIITTGEAEI